MATHIQLLDHSTDYNVSNLDSGMRTGSIALMSDAFVEVLSKIILLTRDSEIKDPVILEQILPAR